MNKPASKKKPAKPKTKILAEIEMSEAVEEILKSDEAKLYLNGIHRATAKLSAVISRELAKR